MYSNNIYSSSDPDPSPTSPSSSSSTNQKRINHKNDGNSREEKRGGDKHDAPLAISAAETVASACALRISARISVSCGGTRSSAVRPYLSLILLANKRKTPTSNDEKPKKQTKKQKNSPIQ